MKKLKLEIDKLSVVSFPTAAAAEARGTVQAHVGTTPGCVVQESLDCTNAWDCAVTSGINSCWCSEYNTCDCALA
jgi:hypothetical protein